MLGLTSESLLRDRSSDPPVLARLGETVAWILHRQWSGSLPGLGLILESSGPCHRLPESSRGSGMFTQSVALDLTSPLDPDRCERLPGPQSSGGPRGANVAILARTSFRDDSPSDSHYRMASLCEDTSTDRRKFV